MVAGMTHGSVVVDVAVDQGGCIETIRPTSHSEPVYELDGVLHYGVTNMPGAVPRTSTYALTNATLPYVLRLAAQGFEDAVASDPALAKGVNVYQGQITCSPVAETFALGYKPLSELLP
jgi:alanine dehydrogenase